MASGNWILWTVFGAVVAVMLALDLGLFHRKEREESVRAALSWTVLWVFLGLAFNVLVHARLGRDKAVEFLTCYITEYALSVDNIFVFLVIFTYFGVPPASRHRVLFWGIFGAMVMRGVFLVSGVALIQRFHWTVYVLGGVLLVTGVKLFFQREDDLEPEKNLVLRLARRFLPVTEGYEGKHFFVQKGKRVLATPLFLALLVVETTDILFAVDSVPAALGISHDTVVLYTSNVFAILGLRSLFFAVSGLLQFLYYLKYGLSAILCFVGGKMLIGEVYKIDVVASLAVVGGILALSVIASVVRARSSGRASSDASRAEGTKER
jgi:tellurite resistance protein TerC